MHFLLVVSSGGFYGMVDLNIWPQVAFHHKVFVFLYLSVCICMFVFMQMSAGGSSRAADMNIWWQACQQRTSSWFNMLPASTSLTSALLPSHWSALELELSDWSMRVAARGFQYGRGLRAAPRGQTAPSAFCYTALDSGLNLDTKLPQS